MTARLGRLTAKLAEPLTEIPAELIDKINDNINPPQPVTAAMVQVRAMYVVNDRVNSFGGRFPIDEHEHLAELLIDSPVLVGHRKDKLPVARTFHAVACTENGEAWVKAYFYWLRSAEGAESLRENIDAGIYKECSIGFTFAFAECSICGRDIRLCSHEPFQQYAVGGEKQECHFNYRQIERVLESSLVYRGATPDTHISRELLQLTGAVVEDTDDLPVLRSVRELQPETDYLVIPRYESLAVTIEHKEGRPLIRFADGSRCDMPRLRPLLAHIPKNATAGRLVGMRGKQRCPVNQLLDFLLEEHSEVRRLVLFLLPGDGDSGISIPESAPVRMIPHRRVTRDQVIRAANEITTRLGVEILPYSAIPTGGPGYHCHPDSLAPLDGDHYRLFLSEHSAHARLELTLDRKTSACIIRQYHHPSLQRGARFLADPISSETQTIDTPMVGQVEAHAAHGDAFALTLTGPLNGRYILRPITIGGQARLLFYRQAESEDARVA